MYGDAVKEFLVFPRALYTAPRDQYILEVIVNNIGN